LAGRLARAVVALDAGVADRAAAARRGPGRASTTTVTPASARARSTFLAWSGVAAADSTASATALDAIRPPAPPACVISVWVSERTSAPVRRASDTNDLPERDGRLWNPGPHPASSYSRTGSVEGARCEV